MADPIIVPRRPQDWFQDGEFTRRAFRFFEEITGVTNTSTQELDDATTQTPTYAQLVALQNQVGSGQALTIDTSGFTIDTTFQTIDGAEV